MDSTGLSLRTLNVATPFHFHFRSRASLFRPLFISRLRKNKCFSPLCSLSERSDGSSMPRSVGEAVSKFAQNKLLQVVLVSPQVHQSGMPNPFTEYFSYGVVMSLEGTPLIAHIPGNTGCIARTCAASAVGLHLVEPLGFQVDDAKLKRAGLDYWPYVVIKVHGSWADFRDYFRRQDGEKRLLAFTKRGTKTHSNFSYRRGDWLIFGSETCGLPPEVLLDCKSETIGGGTIRIPMVETYVRCLNLSVSVGIAVYEASRQLNYEQLQFPSDEACIESENSFIGEDIFA